MFKKNTALPGFPIGHFIQTADGAAKTTGTPTCKRLLDGVGGTLTNAAAYDATAGVWKIDLAAADTNGDMVGLVFTLADCIPISYAIRTSTSLVSDVETDTVDIQARLPAALIGGRMDATVGAMQNDTLTAAALATNAITEIAGAVRTELATELAHLDADVSTAGGLTAQETANAVHNLLPVGTPATGSIGAKINLIDTNVDAIKAVTDALDVSAVTQVAASNAGHLTITVGLTFDEGVTGLTIPADWVTALWTLKNNARDADTAAIVQLRATNPAAGTDGLQRLNGAALVAPITADDGALTVTQATGRIDVYLTDDMTAQLAAVTTIGWDVKFIDEAGDSSGQRGTADVVLTETRATT